MLVRFVSKRLKRLIANDLGKARDHPSKPETTTF